LVHKEKAVPHSCVSSNVCCSREPLIHV